MLQADKTAVFLQKCIHVGNISENYKKMLKQCFLWPPYCETVHQPDFNVSIKVFSTISIPKLTTVQTTVLKIKITIKKQN